MYKSIRNLYGAFYESEVHKTTYSLTKVMNNIIITKNLCNVL
ncbi:hypothetical protein VCHA49P379_110094 [Vibrio chagasii]|nr:hypothetical protein VCHA34P120_140066 [Vibrio chagasii]CAH6924482.1 hypothetical protein VCHA49P379_110094 [Vibrio chagasii]CAH6992671.1 hypothetical protein VCHA29O37_490006 [Vibrio chagasii]